MSAPWWLSSRCFRLSRSLRGTAAARSRRRRQDAALLPELQRQGLGTRPLAAAEGLSSLLLAPWLPRSAPFGNKKEDFWRQRVAPSSGGSSLLSVYLGWCYALAPCTKEKRPRKRQEASRQAKGRRQKKAATTRTKASLYTFDGSGPTCAGFAATPDDSEEGSFLRVRPP